jgi:hypothetical protein
MAQSILNNGWFLFISWIALIGGIGMGWLGGLMAAVAAARAKKWLWCIAVLATGPIAGIPYSFKDQEAEPSRGPMLVGAVLLGGVILVYGALLLLARLD